MEIIIDYIFPIFALTIFLLLHERWKKNYNISVLIHLLIVSCKLGFSVIVTLIMLSIFGFWLGATQSQLLPILALTVGLSYAYSCYVADKYLFDKQL